MKSIIILLLLVAGIVATSLMGPWYISVAWVIVISFIARFNTQQGLLFGGLAMGIVWLMAAFYFGQHDSSNIIGKTSSLIGGLSKMSFISITALLGCVTGLLAGWFGSAASNVFRNSTKTGR